MDMIIRIIKGVFTIVISSPSHLAVFVIFGVAYGFGIYYGLKKRGPAADCLILSIIVSLLVWLYTAETTLQCVDGSDGWQKGLCITFGTIGGIFWSILVFAITWLITLLIYFIFERIFQEKKDFKTKGLAKEIVAPLVICLFIIAIFLCTFLAQRIFGG